MSPAVVWWVEATRAAQGLPRRVEDPAVLARIATLAFAGEEGGGVGRAA